MTRRTSARRRTLFVSSVQKELEQERRAIKDFVQGDALLRRFLDTFLFEDLPASDRKTDDVYLEEVERCDLYLGLFGSEYGSEDSEGFSSTEREFDVATTRGKTRLILVKGKDDNKRHPKMRALIRKAGSQLIRRRFTGISDLTAALYAALVEHLERTGELRTLPFDASACPRAVLADISTKRMRHFLTSARRERNHVLSEKTPLEKALTHLNLLDGKHPSYAAVLLFGNDPQRFVPAAEIKCLHFHGTKVEKPIPSYQVYKGSLFEQVDAGVDFVMSRLARKVGTRARGPEAPVKYEVAKDVVSEAIVNAVAHRDYSSAAGVQVMLFVDRLEVWNPGELPPTLTPERLREPHASIPRNPLIADPLFLAHYIEKAGTGTLDMIEQCRKAGLPEPDFEQRAGQFVVTIWRDWLTVEFLSGLGINDRQRSAIAHIKRTGRITNSEYRELTGVIRKTAARDLDGLVEKGVLERVGAKRGAHYVIARKRMGHL
jgi:ATP-dependent DNA helicase RecG